MTKDISDKLKALEESSDEDLEKCLRALVDDIIMRITGEDAKVVNACLDKRCPYGTPAFKVCDKVMIDTGAGETLMRLLYFDTLLEQNK